VAVSASDAPATLNPATFSFSVSRNGEAAVTVTVEPLGGDNNSAYALASEIREALAEAGLYQRPYGIFESAKGVDVQVVETAGGVQTLRLVALEGTYSLVLGGNVAPMGFALGDVLTAQAPSFFVTVNGGVSVEVFLNGNLSNGVVEQNEQIDELAKDINLALTQAGLLDETAGRGIMANYADRDGNGASDTLIFMVLNPGTGANEIQSFTLRSTAGSEVLGFAGPTETLNSISMVTSSEVERPRFSTIQEMDALLRDPNRDGSQLDSLIRAGYTAYYEAGAEASFVFPIEFSYDFGIQEGVLVDLARGWSGGGVGDIVDDECRGGGGPGRVDSF
ncbi:MAG: hypothetical protein HC904_11850, partial [Blastochloris sp.]|nr:hypothetical protein [Blastochloris sp.]